MRGVNEQRYQDSETPCVGYTTHEAASPAAVALYPAAAAARPEGCRDAADGAGENTTNSSARPNSLRSARYYFY